MKIKIPKVIPADFFARMDEIEENPAISNEDLGTLIAVYTGLVHYFNGNSIIKSYMMRKLENLENYKTLREAD